jgi:hypothetical protein
MCAQKQPRTGGSATKERGPCVSLSAACKSIAGRSVRSAKAGAPTKEALRPPFSPLVCRGTRHSGGPGASARFFSFKSARDRIHELFTIDSALFNRFFLFKAYNPCTYVTDRSSIMAIRPFPSFGSRQELFFFLSSCELAQPLCRTRIEQQFDIYNLFHVGAAFVNSSLRRPWNP